MPDADDVRKIHLIVLDADGVLTDGLIHVDHRGVETKTFHTRDGLGLRLWMTLGYEVGIISGRASMVLQHRARELGIVHVIQGCRDKRHAFGELLADVGLVASQAAVMGDDLPDLPMMTLCGYPMAVADAAEEVRAVAEFVTTLPGGRGAVREAVEHLLKVSGEWDDALRLFA